VVEDSAVSGGYVEDQPPRNSLLFSIRYRSVEDNKLNSRIQYNKYIHIKDTTVIVDVGNLCVWKPDTRPKVENYPLILHPRAENLGSAKRLGCILAVEDRKMRSPTVCPILHAPRVQP
jgi:hypothetical protein